LEFTAFEALQRLAHRVAVSEEERNALTAAFLKSAGSDEEKKLYYKKSEAEIAAEEADAALTLRWKRK
jgi:hypothetical protein